MAGATSSVKVVLTDFPKPILPKIYGELKIEVLIHLHQLISGNAESVTSNLRGLQHEHPVPTMTDKEYRAHTGFAFVPPHNPDDYPKIMGNAQEQAPVTENFRQNQALFQKYTAMDGALKKQIVTAVEPVFLSPLVYQLTGFGQVFALTMLQNMFSRYEAIDERNLKENAAKMMGPYNPVEPLDRLIKQLEKGIVFARSRGQKISGDMMMSKGITLLAQTGIFNDGIREWRRQFANLKTWAKFSFTKRTESIK